MKLQELKKQTEQTWGKVVRLNSAIAQPDSFKPEIRHFGDLRCKSTWERAYCHFHARYICDVCLDAFTVVLDLSITEEDWRHPYREMIFDEFVKLPEALDLLRLGLEQLFIDPDCCTPEERKEGYGVLKLVQEQPGKNRRLPDEFVRRLTRSKAEAQAY